MLNFISEITEVQELRNCLNVSVNRFIFTPRPSAYDFFDFTNDKEHLQKDKQATAVNNKKTHPHVELIFLPIMVEKGFRYDIPCIWISSSSSSSSSGAKRAPTLLYFHGTSGNIGQYWKDLDNVVNDVKKKVRQQEKTGSKRNNTANEEDEIEFDVLVVEVPGYGLAAPFLPRAGALKNDKDRVKNYTQQLIPTDFLFSGDGCLFHPNPDKLRLIADKALSFVLNRRAETSKRVETSINPENNGASTKPRDIILVGRSMGSGLVLELATNTTYSPYIHSVVLISPYTSIPRVIKEVIVQKAGNLAGKVLSPFVNLMLRLSQTKFFDSLENIKKLEKNINVFISHGEKDYFIVKQHSHDLEEAYTESHGGEAAKKQMFELALDPEGDHGNKLDYHDKFVDFLVKRFVGSSSSAFSFPRYVKDPEVVEQKLVPSSMVPKNSQELRMRRSRFIQETKEAAKLKQKALGTLRFVLLMSIVVTFATCYFYMYGIPFME